MFQIKENIVRLFLIKQTLDSDCTIDAISLGKKNGQWEKELKGDTFNRSSSCNIEMNDIVSLINSLLKKRNSILKRE